MPIIWTNWFEKRVSALNIREIDSIKDGLNNTNTMQIAKGKKELFFKKKKNPQPHTLASANKQINKYFTQLNLIKSSASLWIKSSEACYIATKTLSGSFY